MNFHLCRGIKCFGMKRYRHKYNMGRKTGFLRFEPRLILAAALLVGFLCLLVLAMRGCVLSRQTRRHQTEADLTIRIYNEDKNRVETMSLTEYLEGVVAAEMPASFPLEALKAQAVAARTYAVRHMEAYGGSPCGKGGADICTDSACCQAYKCKDQLNAKWGTDAKVYFDKIACAVEDTNNLIAVYHDAPIEALYHSVAGGRTEDAQNVFSTAEPYLVGVDSPGEEYASKYQGTKTVPLADFIKTVNKNWRKAKLSEKNLSKQVEVLSRYESGQVEKIRLGKITASGKEVRKLFDLNSANFTVEIGEAVRFTTTGYGHGVGMSQYGARAMALDGSDYVEILEHYYTGIELMDITALQ